MLGSLSCSVGHGDGLIGGNELEHTVEACGTGRSHSLLERMHYARNISVAEFSTQFRSASICVPV